MAKPRTTDHEDAQQGAAATAQQNSGRCPACNSPYFEPLFEATDRQYRTTDKSFKIVECEKCRLIRLHPRPDSDDLPRYGRPPAWPEQNTAADGMERACRRLVLADDANFILGALEHSGSSGPVLVVSLEGEPLRRTLAGYGAEVIAANAGAQGLGVTPVKPGSCAVVTMLHVLEHLEDPAAALETALGLLAPDGRLVIQTPNAAGWQFLLFGAHWSGIDVPRHLLHFRMRDLELLLDCCGFEVVRRKHFSLHNPARFATSVAPGLNPSVRRARGTGEIPALKVLKHALYFGLMAFAVPFTLLESACRAGSTITIEARKKR